MRLIEKVWFYGHPSKWLLVPLLLPFSVIFWLLSAFRRLCFSIRLLKTPTLRKPVIVVGNISVGGNGKTPVVLYLVDLLKQLGKTPGVISRGYGGHAPYYPYLINDLSTAEQAGDEPILIYRRCKVPVVVGSDRNASANLLIKGGCDIIISDDGLQHYRLSRDIELVIVDGKRLFGNGLLLPAGPLREGQWRLSSSNLVIYNGQRDDSVCHKNLTSLTMTLGAEEVCNLSTGQCVSITEFINSYPGVNAIAGIGAPQRFFGTLIDKQFNLLNTQSFVDHHRFSLADFSQFDDTVPLLMTEKDAVKCQAFCLSNWWYLPVDASFNTKGKQLLKNTIKAVL
jgi:tetraacyldisaccharide 4'-kinase